MYQLFAMNYNQLLSRPKTKLSFLQYWKWSPNIKLVCVVLSFLIFSVNKAQYSTTSLTGFTYDAIANGIGAASLSTNNDLGSGYAFVSADFKATAGSTSPAYALPASGLISSTSTPGLAFQCAPYTGNNVLRIATQNQSGTLTLSTPIAGSFIYILGTSGDGVTTVGVIITFSDATTQTGAGLMINDWYNTASTNLATAGIGRIKRTTNGLEGSSTNPHLYHIPVAIAAANMGKQISSVTITKTDATAALAAIFAISVDTTILSPCTAPVYQASNLMLIAAANSIGLSFTPSVAADKYLILRTVSTTPSILPANGTVYTEGVTLGNSTVVSASASSTFTDAPLAAGVGFTYTVYAYNDVSCTGAAYNTTAPLQSYAATLPNPVNGDTTWVQAQNNIQLDYYNSFYAPVNFPTGNFRKIIMTFTLGKYQCAAGSQYCGDWDYTVTTFLETPADTVEIGRLITPYANASYPRTGWNWKQRYYYDVTDIYPLLQGDAKVRILYSGYSGGFTADVKFAFIAGTPPRSVTGVKSLWTNSYNYGNVTDPIDNHVAPYPLTAPANTENAEMKFTITGHGSDNANCSEFCSKYYQVKENGTMLFQKNIWKPTCGANNIYPQSGTWIYNRANWCPGESVQSFTHKFNNITSGTNFIADVDFQPYTKSGTGTPSYTIGAMMIYYGAFNYALDASVEEIISPANDENNFRANPACGKPVIRIRNTGAATITSIAFEYGVTGTTLQTYTLTGINLEPLAEMAVNLPDLAPLVNMPASNTSEFVATIQQVNGVADLYTANNTMKSIFVTAIDWPSTFKMTLKSSPNSPYHLETKWRIEDMNGAVIAQRNPTATNTTYTDPINNLNNGCYKLIVTDTDCDGGYWWANNSTKGSAYVYPQRTDNSYLPLTNGLPSFPSTLSQDYGCGYTQYFRIGALLPVELLSFSGKADTRINHLYWETAQELNAHHFDLEFSTNGREFKKVSQTPAKGSTNLRTAYHATHVPVVAADIYYYRLKMVDADGSYKFSNVISMKPSFRSFEISALAPNPFTNQLKFTVTSVKSSAATIKLYDESGRVYYQSNKAIIAGINTIVITEPIKISKGIYLFEINIEGEKYAQKVIKN